MSRETDSSSSGPQGRGADAYPSGTPPYGTPAQGATSGAAGPVPPSDQGDPDAPKTETTLTTRIRINIPGSRPIPPVVMRTPMGEAEAPPASDIDAAPAQDGYQDPSTTTSGGRPSALAAYAAGEPGTGSAAASASAAGSGGTGGAGGAGGGASQREEKTSDWFSPRKPATPRAAGSGSGSVSGSASASASGSGSGSPFGGGAGGQGGGNGGAPSGGSGSGLGPGAGPGTGGYDMSGVLDAGPLGGGAARDRQDRPGDAQRSDLPYFSGDPDERGDRDPGRRGPAGPIGPTTGPATGDGPMVPPLAPNPPVPGGQMPPRMSDDTAILTPQKPAPAPGGPAPSGLVDNVSGDTLTSGIPVVPASGGSGGSGGPGGAGGPVGPTASGGRTPTPHTPPKLPDPVQSAPAESAGKKKKKGRNKLVLLGVGVVGVAGVAYGAGLLMNHSDVPKGTTVFGVDIGGGTRDQATAKLEDTLGKRSHEPLKLDVDGKTVQLRPDQAGLSLDTTATVAAAATSDYNPVSVIGSLFGKQRVVDPVMPVDAEKLDAAIQQAAGGAVSSSDGTIKFVPGKAVAVYGKAGKGVDVAESASAVTQAYRTQVETGSSTPVKMATTTRKPTISDAEVDREMKAFGKPAMSANVSVRTDATHAIEFSPQNSLWKFLRVKAVNGKLVDSPDLNALKGLYGKTFDGVLITRGTGKKTPVTPEDVYVALRQALLSTINRNAVIPTNPN
ncbi:hypothetical protein [Streptomyces beihaiensis]|uniref:Peptidoglycan binding domain-containing protein n=1 Tax=Streptomyces beihaiensis TaxID=2984495 RepID=A0ABT3TW38_9ACTN|nr:hypothetical protein [Streptomyces beihaiensis]MCX3061005.1 hypothetical protein [Streptomyces beihaiensis]